MSSGAQYEKKLIRERVRLAMASMSSLEHQSGAAEVARRVIACDAWRDAEVVMLYLATADELDVAALEAAAFESGKRVALPRMDWDAREISAVEVRRSSYRTETRRFGVREPLPGPGAESLPIDEIDLVLTPGLAFDTRGGRLGRGAGFYDRFLTAWRTARGGEDGGTSMAIGACFAAQVVERAPRESHDAMMDGLAWDGGFVMCREKA